MSNNHLSVAIAKQISDMSRLDATKTKVLVSQLFEVHKHEPEFIRSVGVHLYNNVDYTLAGFIFDALTKIYPQFYVAYNSLGSVLGRFGQANLASKAYLKALEIAPTYSLARTNFALILHYFGETGRSEILDAQVEAAKSAYGEGFDYLSRQKIDKSPRRKLHVGYVSGDLHAHPVGQFMRGILVNHDKSAFDVSVFDSWEQTSPSATHEFLKSTITNWFSVRGLSRDALSRLVVDQRVDILIDLAGHSGTGRPDIFVNRISPVQVTYLGYPDSTGIPNMDYRIGDVYADLDSFAGQNSESMARLPHSMWLYTPWDSMPTSTIGGSFEATGLITFGSVNNHAKLQPEWLEVWAKVLSRVPNSKLFLKSRVISNRDVMSGVCQIFKKHGVDQSRIVFSPLSRNKRDHWLQTQKIDIALDAFPFNGATTTCDCLWLGVPVVTKSGNSHVSRTSGSMLNTLGMNDWIAYDDESFIRIAVEKAQDTAGLKDMHKNLNRRFRESTLYDAEKFMSSYESLLRGMWTRYLAGSNVD